MEYDAISFKLSLALKSHLTFFLSCVILEWRNFHGRLKCYALNMEHRVKEASWNNWVKQNSPLTSSPVSFLFV